MRNAIFFNFLICLFISQCMTSCGNNVAKNIANQWQLTTIDATDEALLQTLILEMIPGIKKVADKLPAMFKEQKQTMTLNKFRSTVFKFQENGQFIFEVDEKNKKVINQGTWKIRDNKLFLEGKNPEVLELEMKNLDKKQMILSTKVNFQEIIFTFIPISKNE